MYCNWGYQFIVEYRQYNKTIKIMVKEAYCSFEVAKLLKEKGFDGKCRYYYPNDHTQLISYVDCVQSQMFGNDACIAPTQQMAMAWLREAHHIAINIGWGEVFEEQYRWWSIVLNMDNGDILYDENYQASYEESVETTLKYVLENLI